MPDTVSGSIAFTFMVRVCAGISLGAEVDNILISPKDWM